MPASKLAIVNASPLIFLSRGNRLDLLAHFASTIFVPSAVANEVQGKGSSDITARAMSTCSWLQIVDSGPIPEEIQLWGLGAGESSVLALSLCHIGSEVIIDDLCARRCAATLGIPVRGTLGIVLAAKQRGYIPSARMVMEELIRGGLYLSETVLNAALQRVGE